ncbi:MAG: hypothetical protein ACRDTD_32650 [Pseudonocardiaceae bacterium]
MSDRNDTLPARRHYRALVDGRKVQVVGHLHASPHSPDCGATITPFDDLAEPESGANLFALVSIRCAPEAATIDPNRGIGVTHREYLEGLFGMPDGTNWYLTPVVCAPQSRTYALHQQALTAGWSIGALHDDLLEVVRAAGYAAPATVRVHDFPVH